MHIREPVAENDTQEEVSSEIGSEKSLEKILATIKQNKEITIAELAKIVGISTRGIEKQIDKLKASKIIERVVADKGGYWKIIASNNYK